MTVTKTKRRCHQLFSVLLVGLTALTGVAAENKDKEKEKPTEVPATPVASVTKGEELSSQSKEVLAWANEFSKEITQAIDGWLVSKAISQDRLFSFLYYPVADTDPTKFTTRLR